MNLPFNFVQQSIRVVCVVKNCKFEERVESR